MYNLVHFWLFLIKFLSHVLTGRTEGNAANTNLTNARFMGHSLMKWWCFTVQWSAPCQESWTSPITWTHRACHRPLGSVQPLLWRPGLQSNSKVQVINRRIVSVTTSRNMNVMSLDIFINLSIGISLTVFVSIFLKVFVCMFLKVFVCIFWKVFVCYYLVIACIFWKVFVCYYLVIACIFLKVFVAITWKVIACIFLKVFIAITWKVIACIFLKVFICYYLKSNRLHFFESIRLHVFESIRLNYDEVIELWWTYCILWTMNFMNYELLWTQTVTWWTAVRDPKCCVCIYVCLVYY